MSSERRQVPTHEGDVATPEFIDEIIDLQAWCGGQSYLMTHDEDQIFQDGPTGPFFRFPGPDGAWIYARPGDYIVKDGETFSLEAA